MRHGTVAWLVLSAAVIAYEAAAKQDELLSEAVDRYRDRHPILTKSVIVFLAGHLLRIWPRPIDPLHQLAVRVNRC